MAASVQLHEQQTMGLLHAVLESATNAAIVYDAEHDSFLANHEALELHGLPPASMPFDEWGAYYEARWPGGARGAPGGASAVARVPGRAGSGDAARDPPAHRQSADGRRQGRAAPRRRRAADRSDVASSVTSRAPSRRGRPRACAARSLRTWPRASRCSAPPTGRSCTSTTSSSACSATSPGEMVGRNVSTITASDGAHPVPPPRRSPRRCAATESGTARSRTCARTAPGSGAGRTSRASITPSTASCGSPCRPT